MVRRQGRGDLVRTLSAVRLCGIALALVMVAMPALAQTRFTTAQEAVEALVAATRTGASIALTRILGPGGAALVHSGDPVADRAARARFIAAYDHEHQLEPRGPDRMELIVGADHWPMPIPIVRTASGWEFDTAAGRREILDRRIGRDELAAIEVCRAYVEAQRAYAEQLAEAGKQRAYAQHFISRRGRHDGLYWPTRGAEPQSPLGPLVAQARASGYTPGKARGRHHPYYGYYFRILTAQGPRAPGGAHSYVIKGRMTGGFALLAYPATYGDSGIMTFIVDRDGIVFQRNFGPHTAAIAAKIRAYDPDANWNPI